MLDCEFEQTPDMRLRRSYAKGIPNFSQKLQVQKALSDWYPIAKTRLSRSVTLIPHRLCFLKSREFSESVYGGTEISIKPKIGFAFTWIKPDWTGTNTPRGASNEADKIIQRILYAAIDPDLRDEDESAPTLQVIQETVRVIRGAQKLLDAMPAAQVSTFFGEINITWRVGDRIVRLAVFHNRPSVVQTGSLSNPVGHYKSQENPTAPQLAEKLRDLA